MPTASTWGGLRWRREVANADGNHYVGYTGLDSTDDLVFGSNNGGTQINNNIRITKAGLVGVGTIPTQKFHVSGIAFSDTDFRAPIFYDSNDTAYYVNPNSVSNLSSLRIFSAFDTASSDVYANMRVMRNNATTDGMYIGYGNSGSTSALTRIFGGGATTGELSKYSNYTLEPGSFRSPIFYDSDNTSYYCDPATTSNFNDLYLDGDLRMNGSDSYIWMPNNNTLSTGFFDPVTSLVPLQLHGPSDGIYIGNSAWISYNTANNNNYNENIRLFAASNGVSVIAFRASGASGEPTNSILGFSDRFEIRQAGQWQLRSYANYIEAYGSSRAPIFYDSNNTAYYIDPASTSVLNRIDLPSGSGTINTTTPGQTVYQLNFTGQSTSDNAQAITWGWSTSGAQAGIYVQSSGGYGTKMYIATTDSFATGSKTALTIDHTGVITTNRNYLQATGSLRAPIFYDSDNTAYYIDAASTSNLVGLTVANTITGSISGNAATATNSSQLGGVAAANYVRNDVDGTDSTALFRLTTITKSLTITTSWLDTGIIGANLATGCYMISLYVDNYAVNGGHYQETYTGMISWFSTGTNATDYDEIVLHKSGHAPNGAYINLRTIRQLSGGTNLKLQIISSVSTNGASNYIFKFRRLI
jgi:hypothetical protein